MLGNVLYCQQVCVALYRQNDINPFTTQAMNITPYPLNSKEYHQYQAQRHAAIAALYTGNRPSYLAYQIERSAYHAAEALTAAPAYISCL